MSHPVPGATGPLGQLNPVPRRSPCQAEQPLTCAMRTAQSHLADIVV